MKWTVERIEQNKIVMENEAGVLGTVDQVLLPAVREGDIVTLTVDVTTTEEKKAEMQNRLNRLFKKG